MVTENEQDIGLFKDFTAEETSTTAPVRIGVMGVGGECWCDG